LQIFFVKYGRCSALVKRLAWGSNPLGASPRPATNPATTLLSQITCTTAATAASVITPQ